MTTLLDKNNSNNFLYNTLYEKCMKKCSSNFLYEYIYCLYKSKNDTKYCQNVKSNYYKCPIECNKTIPSYYYITK
jgi:hypothetical protein